MKITEEMKIKRAFESYIKREFPRGGADGEAFDLTPAVDHFIEGWNAAIKQESKGDDKIKGDQ